MERIYSPGVMELWKNPQNAGSLDYPDGYGQVTGPCGDTMQIWLRVRADVIIEATFWTDGCGTSVVCASMVTIMAKGKTLEQAARIDNLLLPHDCRRRCHRCVRVNRTPHGKRETQGRRR